MFLFNRLPLVYTGVSGWEYLSSPDLRYDNYRMERLVVNVFKGTQLLAVKNYLAPKQASQIKGALTSLNTSWALGELLDNHKTKYAGNDIMPPGEYTYNLQQPPGSHSL